VSLGPAELACPSTYSLSNFYNQPFGLLMEELMGLLAKAEKSSALLRMEYLLKKPPQTH
jgi:hypothetical protein